MKRKISQTFITPQETQLINSLMKSYTEQKNEEDASKNNFNTSNFTNEEEKSSFLETLDRYAKFSPFTIKPKIVEDTNLIAQFNSNREGSFEFLVTLLYPRSGTSSDLSIIPHLTHLFLLERLFAHFKEETKQLLYDFSTILLKLGLQIFRVKNYFIDKHCDCCKLTIPSRNFSENNWVELKKEIITFANSELISFYHYSSNEFINEANDTEGFGGQNILRRLRLSDKNTQLLFNGIDTWAILANAIFDPGILEKLTLKKQLLLIDRLNQFVLKPSKQCMLQLATRGLYDRPAIQDSIKGFFENLNPGVNTQESTTFEEPFNLNSPYSEFPITSNRSESSVTDIRSSVTLFEPECPTTSSHENLNYRHTTPPPSTQGLTENSIFSPKFNFDTNLDEENLLKLLSNPF